MTELLEQGTDAVATTAGEAPYWGRQAGGSRAARLLSYDKGIGEDEQGRDTRHRVS